MSLTAGEREPADGTNDLPEALGVVRRGDAVVAGVAVVGWQGQGGGGGVGDGDAEAFEDVMQVGRLVDEYVAGVEAVMRLLAGDNSVTNFSKAPLTIPGR